jgi:uncharacterized protein (TIGR02246 family)
MKLLLIATLAFAQAAAPSQAPHQPAPVLQDDRFVRDLHDKDVEDVLTLYTPNAVFVNPDGKTSKGLLEIRKLYEQVTTTYDSDLHLTTTKLRHTNNAIIEHGRFTETLRIRATGATQQSSGTYVFLHERQPDGTWLIAMQKWNTSPLH